MAGPANSSRLDFVIAHGEAEKLYAPGGLANKIENLQLTDEGWLESITGPCTYERGTPVIGSPHAIFHASLLDGIADTLIMNSGTALRRHEGWTRSWGTLVTQPTALNNEDRPRYPPMMVQAGDRVIFTNGVDRAQVVDADGSVDMLGFHDAPPAPTVEGPTTVAEVNSDAEYPNWRGHSWPGKIGTLGDMLDQGTGKMLAGAWYYWARYESIHGDLGPLSQISEPLVLNEQSVPVQEGTGLLGSSRLDRAIHWCRVEDFLRQSSVQIGAGTGAPRHAKAIWLYRSRNSNFNANKPYFVDRFEGISELVYSDNTPDSELLVEGVATVPVPAFSIMCVHTDRLAVAGIQGAPNLVRISERGYYGTFAEYSYVYLPHEVTGVYSHGGRLLAFTRFAVYDITDWTRTPIPISQGIGCVAPKSFQVLASGLLVWLGSDAFYGMAPGGTPQDISTQYIKKTVSRDLNRGRTHMAVSAVDEESGEYLCAVTPSGLDTQRRIITFDGTYWRRQDIGFDIRDLCRTQDARRYVLACGVQIGTSTNRVIVLNHEHVDYDHPARTAEYESAWLRGDPQALSLFHVRTLYLCMVDGFVGNGTLTAYKNGSEVAVWSRNVRMIGRDEGSRVVTDVAGSAVLGTSLVHDPRLFWRRIEINIIWWEPPVVCVACGIIGFKY